MSSCFSLSARGFRIHGTEGSDTGPVPRARRHAGIKSEPRRAGDERIVGEPAINPGITDDQTRILRDRLVAERALPRAFLYIRTDCGLEPDSMRFDKCDERDRRVQLRAINPRDPVEGCFCRRIDDGKPLQSRQPHAVLIGQYVGIR